MNLNMWDIVLVNKSLVCCMSLASDVYPSQYGWSGREALEHSLISLPAFVRALFIDFHSLPYNSAL